jgi:hypothetical protein
MCKEVNYSCCQLCQLNPKNSCWALTIDAAAGHARKDEVLALLAAVGVAA